MIDSISRASVIVIIASIIWVLPWKGWALWRASQKKQFGWFAAMLVVNLVAILEILYVLIFSREKGERRYYLAAIFSVLTSFTILIGLLISFGWQENAGAACTTEARLCSDGSVVGRSGKDCAFTPCQNGNEPLTGAPAAESFPVEREFTGEPASINFGTNTDAEAFRTLLTRAALTGPNFAGAYTVATWGCGTSCQMSAIIDASTGAIVAYGIPSSSGLAYTKESRLLTVNPFDAAVVDAETNVASDYYILSNGQLQYLGKFDGRTGQPPVCIQVMTKAINPTTKAQVVFPSPCRVPFGWQVIE
ncbi:MAG: DUF5652 family protein [Patescibacteria group bacterium]|jgi:hypothetical protein